VNLSMARRNADIVVKTRSVYPFWDELAGDLNIGQAATGV